MLQDGNQGLHAVSQIRGQGAAGGSVELAGQTGVVGPIAAATGA